LRERVSYRAGDGARLAGLADADFDVVVSYLSWMHFPDASRAAREWSRVLVAGGATDLDGIRRLRDAGIAGIILGEALLSGAIDFRAAMEAAA